MATRRFGTNAVTGLNVGTAAHLIADHELTTSVGGWTDEEGAWRTGRDHVTVHSGSAISSMAIGRMGGQDHTVYIDGNNILDTGSVVGTVTMGANPRVIYVGGKFLILGAADGKNKIYDGDHVRDQGPWQPRMLNSTGFQKMSTADTYTVDYSGGANKITQETEAKIYITVSITGLTVGTPVILDGVAGMTEINGRVYTITEVDTDGSPNWVKINCDSTGFSAHTGSGTLYKNSCGLTGDYKFAITGIVELGNGSILESKLIPIGDISSLTGRLYAGSDAQVYTLSPLDRCRIAITAQWSASGVYDYNISGTIGTDYKPGFRIYRTAADGAEDYYLEKEYLHGDADLTYSAGGVGSSYSVAYYYPHLADVELGALYAAGANDYGSPPQSSLAAQNGQRVFLNDVDNPNRLYISGLDGTEYFNPSDWLIIPDNITVVRRVRDRVVVGTAGRWYLVDMISGFPQVQELDASTGELEDLAVAVSDEGLFFVKPEGIFHLDLTKVSKISRRGIRESDLDDGQAALVTGDVAIFICDPAGAGSTAVACIRDGGWVWHTARQTLQHTHLAKNSLGQIFGALPTKIECLFIGSDYAGSLSSKVYSDGETWQPIRLLLDLESVGAVTCQYQITTNRGSILTGTPSATIESTARRIVELPLTRVPAETFQVNLIFTGNVKLYGFAIEVEK